MLSELATKAWWLVAHNRDFLCRRSSHLLGHLVRSFLVPLRLPHVPSSGPSRSISLSPSVVVSFATCTHASVPIVRTSAPCTALDWMKTISPVGHLLRPQPLSTNLLSTVTFTTLDWFVRPFPFQTFLAPRPLHLFPFLFCPVSWPQSPPSSKNSDSSLICGSSFFTALISDMISDSCVPGAPSRSSLGLTSSSVESRADFALWKLKSSEREMHRDSRAGITFLFASLARWSRFALLTCGLAFGALDAHDNLSTGDLQLRAPSHQLATVPPSVRGLRSRPPLAGLSD